MSWFDPGFILATVVYLVGGGAAYGKLTAKIGRLSQDVERLERAVNNGLSEKVHTIHTDVAVIKKTCQLRGECRPPSLN